MTPDRSGPVAQGEKRGIGATALLLMLPVLCCAGPFLIAAGAGAGFVAWAGVHSLWPAGGAAVVLLAIVGIAWRRRARTRQACRLGCAADVLRGGQQGAAASPGYRHALP